jgi:hypothetical protein
MGFHFENDIDNREYWRLPDCLFIKINLAIDNADYSLRGLPSLANGAGL